MAAREAILLFREPSIIEVLAESRMLCARSTLLCGARRGRAIACVGVNPTDPFAGGDRSATARSSSEANDRLPAVLEEVNVGIAGTHLDGRFFAVNRAFCDLLDRSKAELLQSRFHDLLHPDEIALHDNRFPRLPRGSNRFQHEARLCRPGDEVVWVLVTRSVVAGPAGSAPRVLLVVQDITARKRAESDHADFVRQLIDQQEQERTRIARHLHDEVEQAVCALRLRMGLLDGHDMTPHDSGRQIKEMHQLIEGVDREIHRLGMLVHPTALEDVGAGAALVTFAQRWSSCCRIPVDVQDSQGAFDRMPNRGRITLFRIIEAALSLTAALPGAGHAGIILETRPGAVLLVFEIEGVGSAELLDGGERVAAGPWARRWRELRSRVSVAGGSAFVESEAGRRTTLYVRLSIQGALEDRADQEAAHHAG